MSHAFTPPKPGGPGAGGAPRHGRRSRTTQPRAALDEAAVRDAYRRWAAIYDASFGGISSFGRRHIIADINQLPGKRVLEVGVGTGLALPLYHPSKRVTGIDLSAEMLARARSKVAAQKLAHVDALLEMDAESTSFPDGSFDIAVAMFVASVVPNPRRLLGEMRRVVRPGGHIMFVNHFAAERGPRWWVEWALAPASRRLGWHPDFAMGALLSAEERREAQVRPMAPFGLFTLVQLPN
jgi:phosphatidylethanolamine/phosphatidyl-N-methylethanolamine N-methyltransferase